MPENKYSPPEDRFAARRNVCRMAEPLSAGVTGCVRTVFLKAVAAPPPLDYLPDSGMFIAWRSYCLRAYPGCVRVVPPMAVAALQEDQQAVKIVNNLYEVQTTVNRNLPAVNFSLSLSVQ